jgi:hypothetical protein
MSLCAVLFFATQRSLNNAPNEYNLPLLDYFIFPKGKISGVSVGLIS